MFVIFELKKIMFININLTDYALFAISQSTLWKMILIDKLILEIILKIILIIFLIYLITTMEKILN